MPKIRIREKDITANPSAAENTNVIFLVDANAGEIPELIETKVADKEYVNTAFINKVIELGGKVIVGKSYTDSARYLRDRNQFDVKFLLTKDGDKEPSDGEESAKKTALQLALNIATARRDCVVVYSKNSLDSTEGLAGGYVHNGYNDAEYKIISASLSNDDADFRETKENVGKYVLSFYANDLQGDVSDAGQAYILAYLQSAKTNAEWLAIAGSKRGEIPGATSVGFMKEDEIDTMQPNGKEANEAAINPIVDMNPWGVRIWGNRTAYVSQTGDNGLIASSFANIRILLCDLKKALYKAARKYQFEQNTDVLWVNFQSEVNTLLEEMVHSYGIAGYRWFKEPTTERAKISARLQIIPIEAVEDFDLTIELADSLSVAE